MNMKCAVIDVGSNSVRYAVITPDTVIATKKLNGTVLADGLFFSGKLSDAAMERTADAIAVFCENAKREKADEIYVFATEAVRAASNGSEFVKLVYERTGIAVDVIDGASEAQIGFAGAVSDTKSPVTVFDIGGASSEIICGENGKIIFEKSSPIGCVRLRDGAGGSREKAEKLIADRLPDKLPKTNKAIGIGGTATALGAMSVCPEKYDPFKVHASTVTAEFLRKIADRFFGGENLQIAYPSLTDSRAKIIGYGALAAIKILKLSGLNEFTVSERDNIEGYYMLKSGIRKNSEKL